MNDDHYKSLERLCRFCGLHLTEYYCEVSDYAEDIKTCFYIDVSKDTPDVHPKSFCHKCKSDLNNVKKRGSTVANKFLEWTKHTTKCLACDLDSVTQTRSVGRPKKEKKLLNPKWTRKFSNALIDMCTQSSDLPPISCLEENLNPNLNLCVCLLCLNLLDQPVLNVHCQHVVCLKCLLVRIEGKDLKEIECPICPQVKEWDFLNNLVVTRNSFAPALTTIQIIENLRVPCKRRCGKTFTIGDQNKGEHENYCFYEERKVNAIEDIFNFSPEEEIPQLYEDAALHIIKAKMSKSELPNQGAAFKTGGPKVFFKSFS